MRQRAAVVAGSAERSYANLLLIVIIAAFVVIAYSSSFITMARLWQHSDHRYGVLVFPIAAYFLWGGRDALARLRPRPSIWGLVAIGGLVAVIVVSRAVAIQVSEHLAAVLLIPAAVAAFLGVSILGQAVFPLLFLVAAVPMGDALVPWLMRATADVSASLLRLVGVPVFREGQFMTLPGGDFEVADICSGLRYLTSGTIVALLFAYISYRSNLKRAGFVAIAAAVFIVANGVRAFVVMLVASATDMRYFAGREHVYFGWLLFGGVAVALFWFGARFADPSESGEPGASENEVTAQGRSELLPLAVVLALVMLAATARPFEQDLGATWLFLIPATALLFWVLYRGVRRRPELRHDGEAYVGSYDRASAVAIILVAVGLLVAGPALIHGAGGKTARLETLELPAVPECGSPQPWSLTWQPQLEAPDRVASGSYSCSGDEVSAFIAAYSGNVQGAELVSSKNSVIPSAWRRFTARSAQSFTTDGGSRIGVNEVSVQGGGTNSLIWYWYRVGRGTTTGATGAKLLQAYELVTRARSEDRIYLVETPLTTLESSEFARRRLSLVALRLMSAASANHENTTGRDAK